MRPDVYPWQPPCGPTTGLPSRTTPAGGHPRGVSGLRAQRANATATRDSPPFHAK